MRLAVPVVLTVLLPFGSVLRSETLTLPEAVRRALAQNQSIAISRLDREIASANVSVARGRFDPVARFKREQGSDETPIQPGGTGTANWRDSYELGLTGVMPWGATYALSAASTGYRGPSFIPNEQNAGNASLSFTQPLLRGFGFPSSLEQLRVSKANKRIADWQFQVSVLDTVTAVVAAYTEVLESRELLRINEGYRDAVRQLSMDHERRLSIGAIAEADLANAQSRTAQIEESVQFSRQSVKDAETRLMRLLGGPIDSSSSLILEEPTVPPVSPIDIPAEISRALKSRPDVLAVRQGLVRAQTIQSARRMDLLPGVDFVATIGYGDLDTTFGRTRDSVLDREHRLYSAGIVVSVPLTQTEARGRYRAARAAVRQSEQEISAVEADVALGVDKMARFLMTAASRVQTLERAEALAKKSVEAEEKRLRAGTGNTFFVLQQQGDLAQVQGSLVRAKADLRRARAYFERETVRTFERFNLALE